MSAMYRVLPLLLWATVVVAAPQDVKNTDITYVKMEPIIDDTPAEKADNHRQSRIENLPLTIPGNVTKEAKEVDISQSEPKTNPKFKRSDNRSKEDSRENTSTERVKKYQRRYTFRKNTKPPTDNEIKKTDPVIAVEESKPNETKTSELHTNLSETNTIKTDTLTETKPITQVKVSENSEELHDIKETSSDEVDPTVVDIIDDNVAAETNKIERQIDITTASYETNDPGTSEVTTAKLELQNTTRITVQENQTKKYTKLGYFGKSYNKSLNNLIEKSGKRRYRSKCRCEKIWNCPKLQITVPRCPDEYFMCCF